MSNAKTVSLLISNLALSASSDAVLYLCYSGDIESNLGLIERPGGARMHTRADKEAVQGHPLDGACNDSEDRADPDQYKLRLIVLDDPIDIFRGQRVFGRPLRTQKPGATNMECGETSVA